MSYTESSYKAEMSTLCLGRDLPPLLLDRAFALRVSLWPFTDAAKTVHYSALLNTQRLFSGKQGSLTSLKSFNRPTISSNEEDSRARFYRKCRVHTTLSTQNQPTSSHIKAGTPAAWGKRFQQQSRQFFYLYLRKTKCRSPSYLMITVQALVWSGCHVSQYNSEIVGHAPRMSK